ncbi:hypothetical protein [Bradyrhizobium elkanii]|uniref:hypothetical protein n=1 Tax=Bradyrhizobium elkanii TaxID=29448 RepID=UPI003D1989E3
MARQLTYLRRIRRFFFNLRYRTAQERLAANMRRANRPRLLVVKEKAGHLRPAM